MKTLFKSLACICMASSVVACSGKNKSSETTTATTDNVMQSSNSDQGENSETLSDDPTIKWGGSDLAAIVFLGYYSDTEKAMETARKEYGHDARCVELEGDECYLIIPRSPEAIIDVRHYSYDVVTNTETAGKTVYNGSEAPVLLRCNISDIQANAQVTVTLKGKKAVFEPKLDLRDGTINLPVVTPAGQGTMLDITKYKQELGEPNEHSCVYDCDPMKELNIEALLKNGRVSILINKENMQKMYPDDRWGYTVEEVSFNIEGLEGVCKKIFWGNWGQDINPLLCMLMDDGGVEILDVKNAIDNYDFISSGRLPDLQNIVSFKHSSDPGGTGVIAIDNDGKEHYIEMFLGTSSTIHFFEKTKDGTMHQELTLTPDWKICFGSIVGEEDYSRKYEGRFRGKPNFEDNETATYTFEFLQALAEDPNSEIGVSMKDTYIKGSFTMKRISNEGVGYDYEIEVTSGNVKFAGTEPKPRFTYRNVDPFSYKAID